MHCGYVFKTGQCLLSDRLRLRVWGRYDVEQPAQCDMVASLI